MSIKVISLLALLVIGSKVDIGSSVKLDHKWIKVMNVASQNLKMVKAFNMTNKNGDRTFGGQFTLLKDLSKNLNVQVKTYFDRKKKIVPTPMRVSPNICEAFEKNYLKLRTIFQSSNLTDCPIKAGTYRINNWIPDENEIPNLPPGRYQVDFTFVDGSEEYATFRWAGGILK